VIAEGHTVAVRQQLDLNPEDLGTAMPTDDD
jgi:hypothetical protein